MAFCCLDDVDKLDDLPDDTLARFFELLAEAQERRQVWRLPPRLLADMLRTGTDALPREWLIEERGPEASA